MRDTFLNRAVYVGLPIFGTGFIDKVSVFAMWLITAAFTSGNPVSDQVAKVLPLAPPWLSWLLGTVSLLLSAYHLSHPETGAALAGVDLGASGAPPRPPAPAPPPAAP